MRLSARFLLLQGPSACALAASQGGLQSAPSCMRCNRSGTARNVIPLSLGDSKQPTSHFCSRFLFANAMDVAPLTSPALPLSQRQMQHTPRVCRPARKHSAVQRRRNHRLAPRVAAAQHVFQVADAPVAIYLTMGAAAASFVGASLCPFTSFWWCAEAHQKLVLGSGARKHLHLISHVSPRARHLWRGAAVPRPVQGGGDVGDHV